MRMRNAWLTELKLLVETSGMLRSRGSNIVFRHLCLCFCLCVSISPPDSAFCFVDISFLDFCLIRHGSHEQLQIPPPDYHLTNPSRITKLRLPFGTSKALEYSHIYLAHNMPIS